LALPIVQRFAITQDVIARMMYYVPSGSSVIISIGKYIKHVINLIQTEPS